MLLVATIGCLLDRPRSGLGFRPPAEGLSVTTYTLVYRFGTRAELVRAVVSSMSERQDRAIRAVQAKTGG